MHDQKLIKQQRTPVITKTSKLKYSRNLNQGRSGATHNQSATAGMLLGGTTTTLLTKRATLTDVLKNEPLPKCQTRQDVYLRLKLSELQG